MSDEAVNPRPDVNVLARLVDKNFIGNQQFLMKIMARRGPAFLIFLFYAGIKFTKWETHAMLLSLFSDLIIIFQERRHTPYKNENRYALYKKSQTHV